MKIAVIGAGAMGSIYASFLAKNNNEEWQLIFGKIIWMQLKQMD